MHSGLDEDGRPKEQTGLGKPATLQQRHLLAKLGNLQRLRLNHLVALPQGCWLAKTGVLLRLTVFIKATAHSYT